MAERNGNTALDSSGVAIESPHVATIQSGVALSLPTAVHGAEAAGSSDHRAK